MDFKAKLSDVPTMPGVYMMLDKSGTIIYVGKAKNLRNRLRQYFQNSANHTTKVSSMMESVADFRYIITASEIDALVTENNLIKKQSPKYNILLKDDKSYPFLRVDIKEKFPTISIVRKLKKDGARYFGPYMQAVNYREIMDLIHSAFKIRECSLNMNGKPRKPCLNYHLNRCMAPCTKNVDELEYRKEVARVLSFLKGNDKEVEKILNEKMKKFASEDNFECAIMCRDKLKVLQKLGRKQISALPNESNMDIFAIKTDGVNTVVSKTIVRTGKIMGSNNFSSKALDTDLASYLFQYYENNQPLCDEILLEDYVNMDAILPFQTWLSERAGKNVVVSIPKIGVKRQLVNMTKINARDCLQKLGDIEERKQRRTVGAVEQLHKVLNLQILPKRIEAYDISHISGTDKVASMVVFVDGEPKKKYYRKFKIKTVEGNNDFACMKETLIRRFGRLSGDDESFSQNPDLILIDGGKGQLGYAKEAMEEAGVDFQILSLAKRIEEVYITNDPILIPKDNVSIQLLQRVRDEAHRFAVTFHKNLRNKRMKESQLLEVEGIGKKRLEELFKKFECIDNIKNATIEELIAVNGMNVLAAENLKRHFEDIDKMDKEKED